jgi:prepilin-type N-terminal cleavage/methylation domain-containing protein
MKRLVGWAFARMRGVKPRLGHLRPEAAYPSSPTTDGRAAASRRDTRRGFTLLEIVIALAILGIAIAVVGLSAAALESPIEADVPATIAAARSDAIRTGQAVTLEFAGGVRVTLHPDGSATPARVWDGEAYWRVDPWTGEARRE